MSNDSTKTENIIAPAMGRALSAIAQKRTIPVSAKLVLAEADNKPDALSAASTCARSAACCM